MRNFHPSQVIRTKMKEEIKCKKCGGKRFFGKYTDKPYCIDCGTFTEKSPKLSSTEELPVTICPLKK